METVMEITERKPETVLITSALLAMHLVFIEK